VRFPIPLRFRLRKGITRVELKYDASAVTDVPLTQAMSNLFLTCFGSPGTPLTLLTAITTAGEVGLLFPRVFRGMRYLTGVMTRQYIAHGFKLRNHPRAPMCDEFVVRVGSLIAKLASGWGRPVMIVCQLPTGALWRHYDTVPDLARKYVSYSGADTYAPSKTITTSFFDAVVRGGYPFTYVTCGSGSIESCNTEALLAAADEDVSTMIYALNMSVTHPRARKIRAAPTTAEDVEVRPHE